VAGGGGVARITLVKPTKGGKGQKKAGGRKLAKNEKSKGEKTGELQK